MRLSQNRPDLDFAQMCVNPKKSNVSGLPRPRSCRRREACRPNSISRVLSGCNSSSNFASRLAKLVQEPSRILFVLKAHGEIVGEPHDDHVTARVVPPPPIGP